MDHSSLPRPPKSEAFSAVSSQLPVLPAGLLSLQSIKAIKCLLFPEILTFLSLLNLSEDTKGNPPHRAVMDQLAGLGFKAQTMPSEQRQSNPMAMPNKNGRRRANWISLDHSAPNWDGGKLRAEYTATGSKEGWQEGNLASLNIPLP